MYINNFCSISAIGEINLDNDLSKLTPSKFESKLSCLEPDYSKWLNPMQLRRMTKTSRIAIGASQSCWNTSMKPESIHIGTALGMVSDTLVFLEKLILQKEQMLTPTAFIQSTHNTVSGQIALLMNAEGHNMTFSHKGHSFESAIIDAHLMLSTSDEKEILVGSVDELTTQSYEIQKLFGIYTNEIPAGEGSSFFRISNYEKEDSIAKLNHFHFFKTKETIEIVDQFQNFLIDKRISVNENDLFILGDTESEGSKIKYQELQSALFKNNCTVNYKLHTGEFPTASGIGLSFGLSAIFHQKKQKVWLLNNFGDYWGIWLLESIFQD